MVGLYYAHNQQFNKERLQRQTATSPPVPPPGELVETLSMILWSVDFIMCKHDVIHTPEVHRVPKKGDTKLMAVTLVIS